LGWVGLGWVRLGWVKLGFLSMSFKVQMSRSVESRDSMIMNGG